MLVAVVHAFTGNVKTGLGEVVGLGVGLELVPIMQLSILAAWHPEQTLFPAPQLPEVIVLMQPSKGAGTVGIHEYSQVIG